LGGVWATFMGMADAASEWKTICGTIKEKRLMSLLGSLSLDGLRYVADYLKDHFSITNLVIGGAAGLVGLAAAVKLYKVIKATRKLSKFRKAMPSNVHHDAQGKHIVGHKNFIPGRSTLANGVDPQELINGVKSGVYKMRRSIGDRKVVV